MKQEHETWLPRVYRVRVLGFVVAGLATAGLLYVGQDFLATLHRLDVVIRDDASAVKV